MIELFIITLEGCDDYTDIKVYLSKKQKKLIEDICKLSYKKSSYCCMPTMSIKKEKA